MDVVTQVSVRLRQRIETAIVDASERDVTIFTTDGESFEVFGQVFLGADFIEFQPSGSPNTVVVVPFDKIARLMV